MTYQEAILTFTNTLILFMNINVLLVSGLTLYFNGGYFKRSNTIRKIIRWALIISFCKACAFMIPCIPWVMEKSYLQMSFWQALGWANMHIWAFAESILVNMIGCHVGVKNCQEIRDFILQKERNLERFLVNVT